MGCSVFGMVVQLILIRVFFLSIRLFMFDSVLLVGVFGLVFSLLWAVLIRFYMSSWFGAIVVVVYVGGLLVMFSYFLAIFPNQNVGGALSFLYAPAIGLVFVLLLKVEVFCAPVVWGGGKRFRYFYSGAGGIVLLFLVYFLLLRLLCVVSVVRRSRGPFRPFVA